MNLYSNLGMMLKYTHNLVSKWKHLLGLNSEHEHYFLPTVDGQNYNHKNGCSCYSYKLCKRCKYLDNTILSKSIVKIPFKSHILFRNVNLTKNMYLFYS